MARVTASELELGLPPRRIQRTRARGWRMPAGAIYVGRPSRYGNDWRVVTVAGSDRFITNAPAWDALTLPPTPEERAELVARHAAEPMSSRLLEELRGHDLACWCPLDEPCHADTLLELANLTPADRLARSIALDRQNRGIITP